MKEKKRIEIKKEKETKKKVKFSKNEIEGVTRKERKKRKM